MGVGGAQQCSRHRLPGSGTGPESEPQAPGRVAGSDVELPGQGTKPAHLGVAVQHVAGDPRKSALSRGRCQAAIH